MEDAVDGGCGGWRVRWMKDEVDEVWEEGSEVFKA